MSAYGENARSGTHAAPVPGNAYKTVVNAGEKSIFDFWVAKR